MVLYYYLPDVSTDLFGGGGSSTFGGTVGGTDSSMNFATSTGRFSSGAGGVGTSGFNVTVSQPTTGGNSVTFYVFSQQP